jgi:hypothetical protein
MLAICKHQPFVSKVLVDGRSTIAGLSIGVDRSLTPVGEVGTARRQARSGWRLPNVK